MAQYLVFSGSDYYPAGGAEDFLGAFSSMEEAVEQAKGRTEEVYKWAHVAHFDGEDLKVVWP